MSFNKTKGDPHCLGGRQRYGTVKSFGNITSKSSKVLIGYCSKCNRKKSMTVSDNPIQPEGISDFSKNPGKKGLIVSKKMAKKVLKDPSRAFDITAKIATAAASRNPKNITKTLPELITFYNTVKVCT